MKAYEFQPGKTYTAYADGSSLNNGAPNARGGWAFVILDREERWKLHENWGNERGATNNQMELRAAIEAIEAIPKGCGLELKLDSQYVLKGSTEWIHGWIRTGFKKNEGLWRRMMQATEGKKFKWTWVKGHSTSHWNAYVDRKAVESSSSLSI